MKKYIPYIIIAVVLIALHVYLYINKPDPMTDVKAVKEEAKAVVDSLLQENRVRDMKIAQREKIIDSLRTVTITLEKETETINKVKDEKIILADHYTLSELNSYFAERYPNK